MNKGVILREFDVSNDVIFSHNFLNIFLTSPLGEVLERCALAAADVSLDEDGVGTPEVADVGRSRPHTTAALIVVGSVLGRAAEKVTGMM